jgi:pimeloyl-ACP methyl ester carboxylesterase
MPFAQADGARLYWRCDGPDAAPPLLLGNSIGCDHSLWDAVMPSLMRVFRVIRWDMRGHGASDVTPGEYSMERLGRDALAVADAAGATRFHYAGISLGGMVGMWLGANAPERIQRLALCNMQHRAARGRRRMGCQDRHGARGRHGSHRGHGDGPLFLPGIHRAR